MSPKCFTCGGTGKKSCQYCKGTGVLIAKGEKGKKEEHTCAHCGGSGEIRCHVCAGTGRR